MCPPPRAQTSGRKNPWSRLSLSRKRQGPPWREKMVPELHSYRRHCEHFMTMGNEKLVRRMLYAWLLGLSMGLYSKE